MKIFDLSPRVGAKILTAVLVVLLLALWLQMREGSGENVELVPVKRADLQVKISAPGVLTGRRIVDLRFTLPGKLYFIGASVGGRVREGEVVASLDNRDLVYALEKAENVLKEKQAVAEKVEDDVKGHGSDETFLQKQTRTQAQTARDNAYNDVKIAKKNLSDMVLRSPVTGIVIEAGKVSGQFVSSADIIIKVADDGKVFFDAEIDESDIGKIALGQRADVLLNGSDKPCMGSVDQIFPESKVGSNGSAFVAARIDLTGCEIRFIQNLNGQADVVTETAGNVLVIPQESLSDDGRVYVKSKDGYVNLAVETGLQTESGVEVKKGLAEGQLIVKNPARLKIKRQLWSSK